MATVAMPIVACVKMGEPNKIIWGDSQERAFLTLQSLLSQAPVLRLPDFSKPFIVLTDASNVGLGAALCQEHDGDIFPIAYASKKLLDRKTRYSVFERE